MRLWRSCGERRKTCAPRPHVSTAMRTLRAQNAHTYVYLCEHVALLCAFNPCKTINSLGRDFSACPLRAPPRKTMTDTACQSAVWKSVIAERHHIHLNATKWITLTEFVKYIGKEGLADVDVDEEVTPPCTRSLYKLGVSG